MGISGDYGVRGKRQCFQPSAATHHPFPLPSFAALASNHTALPSGPSQIYEVKLDSLMKRTMNRPLPSGRLSRLHALAFALGTGVAGTTLLATKVSTTPLLHLLPLVPRPPPPSRTRPASLSVFSVQPPLSLSLPPSCSPINPVPRFP